jgi:hypothetical protein
MAGATGEKYHYIRDQQLQAQQDANYLIDQEGLPLLPVWENTEAPTIVEQGQ